MNWKDDALLILGFWSLYSPIAVNAWHFSEQSFSLGITLFMGIFFIGIYAGIRYFLIKSQNGKKEEKETPPKEEEEKPQEILDTPLEVPLPSNNQKEVQEYDLT